MEKGKILLGVAAAVVTVASGLAFKVAKFSTHKAFVKTSGGLCKACTGLWTNVAQAGDHNTQCKTSTGGNEIKGVATSGGHKYGFFTKTLSGHACPSAFITRTTISL